MSEKRAEARLDKWLWAARIFKTHTLAADACKTAGAALGFFVGWEVERRYVHAQTQAPWWGQAAKYVVGLALSLAIKSGLKYALGTALWADGLRYGLVVLWVVAVYPAIFTRIFRKR